MTNVIPKTVAVGLDDLICADSPSSHEFDWTDTASDTSSNMSGSWDKFESKSPNRRVHFDSGLSRESSKRSRVNRNDNGLHRPATAATSIKSTATEGSSTQDSGQQTQQNAAPQTNNNNLNHPTLPGVAPYNNTAPIPTAGQQVFVHHTGSFNQPYNNNYGQHPTNFVTYPSQPYPTTAPSIISAFGQPAFVAAPVAMSGYVNPPNPGIHFQPQVPDTTNGPYVHTYHPRHDQAQTFYVPAVGANVYLQCPPINQQPVLQQPVIQQPVIYQMQIPVPPAVCQATHYYAHGGVIPVQAQGGTVLTAPATAAFTPIVVQQPAAQPVMMAGGQPQHVVQQPVMVNGVPHVVAGNATSFQAQPAMLPVHNDPVLGIGQTSAEIMTEQMKFAHENGLFDAQDFKPKDDDPSRYYMVRELDGTWTQRNRFTIDSLNCRWYLADQGYFYAVRVPES